MNASSALVLFVTVGLAAANGGAWFAFRRGSSGRKVAVLAACYAAWTGLGFWLDPGMAGAARPYHALASSIALYVVLGFPAFVLARLTQK